MGFMVANKEKVLRVGGYNLELWWISSNCEFLDLFIYYYSFRKKESFIGA